MVQISRGTTTGSRSSSSSILSPKSILHIVFTLFGCVLSFYTGTLSSMDAVSTTPCDKDIVNSPSSKVKYVNSDKKVKKVVVDSKIESIVQQRVEAELSKAGRADLTSHHQQSSSSSSSSSNTLRFDKTVSNIAQGMVRISKEDFTETFDYGTPVTKGKGTGEAEALLFYNTPKAFPSDDIKAHRTQYHSPPLQEDYEEEHQEDEWNDILKLDAEEATENCEQLNVITTANAGNTRQCTAIVPNHESYHVQRWMRLASEQELKTIQSKDKLNPNMPLRPVSRGTNKEGHTAFHVPDENQIRNHWNTLKTYFESVDDVMDELKPIVDKIAVDNTVIVMTCNMGQSELLMNFVCSAKRRGLDFSNVLVFPTDEETRDLAEGMGLTTYFDTKNFGDLPKGEAKHYGDRTFVAMMFAKVVCVQLINQMGYDLLFQDVDVIWYKNPLQYFHDESNPYYNFDMYFQDDGAHTTRYAPTSANSGFYYVRNNPTTQYFFTSLLYAGDLILRSHSHQQAMVQLMAEHSNLFGLKVKVLDREMEEFPGGFHFHQRKDFMKRLVQDEVENAQIFHMSWTKNKDNKLNFFQQMGEWHLDEKCMGTTKDEISNLDSISGSLGTSLDKVCCLPEPKIKCHYRDKPSIIPCRDSDPIDEGRKSFW